jgi:Ca2+-binding RTX toxin-like protein
MNALLDLERMEERRLLSATVALTGGTLNVLADNSGDNIVIQQTNNGQTTEVLVNSEAGKTYDFAAGSVTSINFQGGTGNDYFANNTNINSIQHAGSGAGVTYLQGGTGKDILIGGGNPEGKTYETANSGQATFIGGAGFNNIFGGKPGGSDTIFAGPGKNAVYDILGTDTVYGGSGSGYLIVNAASQVFPSAKEQVVTFFQKQFGPVGGVTTGSPTVLQNDVNGNGILYLVPQSPSASWTVNQVGTGTTATLSVIYNDANGQQTFSFAKSQVSWIASFGGTGNNTYVNNTNVNDVFYGGLGGAAVQHTIIGGFGTNVIKGHSGTNFLEARGTYNDLTAGSGTDFLTGSNVGRNVFRSNRTSEVTWLDNFHNGDLVLGLPASINGQMDPNFAGTITNADYAFWYLYLKNHNSI